MKTKKVKKPAPPKSPPDFMPACRKIGKGVAFSFHRAIRKARGCDEHEARLLFEAAVREGKILEAGTNATGDVKYFEAKLFE